MAAVAADAAAVVGAADTSRAVPTAQSGLAVARQVARQVGAGAIALQVRADD